MIATIIELLKEFLVVIPIINKWFTKTTESKIEDVDKGVSQEQDNFKKTGRPKWNG